MKTIRLVGGISGCVILLVACGGAADRGESGGASAQSASATSEAKPTEPAGASGAGADVSADGGVSPGFFQCKYDTDCVAVGLIEDCCYNGWQIAVARSQEEAYVASTACPAGGRHLCPEYVVKDERVPACQFSACVMVDPDRVRPEGESKRAE